MNTRDVAVRFLSKPMTTRKGIIADLGLRQDDDGQMPRDREWNVLMLARVVNEGKLADLIAHPAMFGNESADL